MSSTGPLKLNATGALLHRQLYVLLKEQIASGRLRPGEKLPTQEALCAQFSVSRITVRRALADLQADGLIRNEQGVGAFVTAGAAATGRRGPGLGGFVGELRRTLEETTVKLLSLERERCPSRIAAALGLAEDEPTLHVVRTRSRGRTPVMLLDGWIPQRCAAAVTPEALLTTPLYQLVSGGPDRLGRVVQEINGALADPVVAQALGVDVNSATLRIERLVHDRDGAPIQHLTIWSSPQRSRLVMEVAADGIDGPGAGRLLHDVQG